MGPTSKRKPSASSAEVRPPTEARLSPALASEIAAARPPGPAPITMAEGFMLRVRGKYSIMRTFSLNVYVLSNKCLENLAKPGCMSISCPNPA